MRKHLHPYFKRILISCCFTLGVLLNEKSFSQTSRRTDSTRAENKDSLNPVPAIIPLGKLPQTIPVLYGEQSRKRLVQSISYLNGKKLESAPVTMLKNAFAGQLAGLHSTQTNGAPRFDNPNLSLRGRNPLIVVDGIPRYNLVNLDNSEILYDVLSINPEQVESVTLLKDALSTVMLGNQAMNGILMVTTRKSPLEKSSSLTVTAQTSLQTPIGMRKTLSSFDYASLYNEAAVNSGLAPVYTPSQLGAYKNGTDPLMYPNIEWQQEVLRNNAPAQRYNISAGGSLTNVRYFLSLDYQSQTGLLKEPADSVEVTNVDYKRYIFRTNVEFRVDKNLTLNLNAFANIQDFNQPGAGVEPNHGYKAVFNSLLNTPDNATPVYNSDGSFAGTRLYPTNPYAESIATGHYQNNLQAATIAVNAKRLMDDVIKGAWVKAALSYNPAYEQQINRSRNYNAFNFPVAGDPSQFLRVNTVSLNRSNASAVIERLDQIYGELSAGIDRTWNKSALTGMILGHYNSIQGNNQLNQVYKTLSSRLAYSLDDKYNVEVAAAYSGNNRFAPGNQYDIFPAAGASWNMHNEQLFKSIKLLNELKVRASYGKVGNANPGYYLYRQTYVAGADYFFSTGATNTGSIHESALANPNRVTEKAEKLNVGLDVAYSNNRGWFTFDYYNNRQYDLLQPVGMNSAVFGQTFPDINIGKNKYYGFEATAGWADRSGKLNYNISGNFSSVASRIIFNDEPAQPLSYQLRTGYSINQIRGYVSEGLFNNTNLNAPTMAGFVPVAGDAKYKDLNNDGVINILDQTVIGNNRPLLFYGANLGFQLSGFDLNVLIQGVANRDILTTGNYQFPFGNNGKGQAYEYNLERYTPETAATATLPRVTLGSDFNNYIASSLFVRNGSYLRLKNLEIGYSLNAKLLSMARLKTFRFFLNGQNLLTYSKYKESDPENYTGLYPLQRIINGGLTVKL